MDVYKLSAQLTVINRDNIHSIGELDGKIERLNEQCENTRQELNALQARLDKLNSLTEQVEDYFKLIEKPELSNTENLRMKMLGDTLKRNSVNGKEDMRALQRLRDDASEKVKVLTAQFNDCGHLCEVYADIADTYWKISKGDYISNLIDEKQKQEQQQTVVKKKHGR